MSRPPYPDEELVPISFLNDYLYCPRRCGLHHVEGLWSENVHTMSGQLEHQHIHDEGQEYSGCVRIVRALPLVSRLYGLVGKADAVEMATGEPPSPVDYKHGPKRQWENDDVQLCAQALCLEEMLGVSVERGAIFHAKTRRRRTVEFSDELRALTLETAEAVRRLLAQARTPAPEPKPQCQGCSIRGFCLPELGKPKRKAWDVFTIRD